MNVKELISFLNGFAGPFNQDEGIRFGNIESTIEGIMICWMAIPDAITFAKKNNANFVICHEDLFLPYGIVEGNSRASDFLCWEVNRRRVELLSNYSMTVMRMHGSLDKKYILNALARQLGLTQGLPLDEDYVGLYAVKPVPVCDLVAKIKDVFQLNGIRTAVGDPQRNISRIALLLGGMGLFVNASSINHLLMHNPDVCIAGETDNYAIRMITESGVDLIEISHELSENEGLKDFSNDLAMSLKDTNVHYYQTPCCWKMR
jgi:putative NIF3 family GTP cyclohydrolase 1 type 2